jgi:hypothetical protein
VQHVVRAIHRDVVRHARDPVGLQLKAMAVHVIRETPADLLAALDRLSHEARIGAALRDKPRSPKRT